MSSRIDFKTLWPRNGHADSLGVKILNSALDDVFWLWALVENNRCLLVFSILAIFRRTIFSSNYLFYEQFLIKKSLGESHWCSAEASTNRTPVNFDDAKNESHRGNINVLMIVEKFLLFFDHFFWKLAHVILSFRATLDDRFFSKFAHFRFHDPFPVYMFY